jgi:hypothetical protein
MGDAAFHGLAGRIVKTIEPETEASSELLLVSFLVAFGNWIGRGPHKLVEATRHYTNEFAVMVGDTSVGRKGTGWDRIRKLFEVTEQLSRRNEIWTDRIKSGLASGEGLIMQVKDGGEEDSRVDKRLMVFEPEFARALIVINREGNTLSAIIRNAWESGNLHTLTKTPIEATDAHMSIIGHITVEELRKRLKSVEIANGFANRFMYVAVRRSKSLPFGGGRIDYEGLAQELLAVGEKARRAGTVRWAKLASSLWAEEYERLSQGNRGLFGTVTNRAAPHVLRLAMLYALLRGTETIALPDMDAALEVWRYCEDSARYIFGNDLGDETADTILRALKSCPQGVTRTEISELFSRNADSAEIGRALLLLKSKRLAKCRKEGNIGRPVERWFAS